MVRPPGETALDLKAMGGSLTTTIAPDGTVGGMLSIPEKIGGV